MKLKKSKRIMSYLLAAGLSLSSVTAVQSNLCAAAGSISSKKNVETKRYVISQKAGTYSSAIKVTVKAKKGYKVYYSTSGKLTVGKYISSGKKKSVKINRTKTLSVYAVKKSEKVSGKTLKNIAKRKKSKYFKTYKYIIQTQQSTSSPQATDVATAGTIQPVATETPAFQ